MHSSSRIVSAEEVVSFEPFALDSLSLDDGGHGGHGRHGGNGGHDAADHDASDEALGTADLDDDPGHHDGHASHGDQAWRDGYRQGFREGEAQALSQCEARDQALGATLQERTEVLLQSLEAEFQGFQTRHADRLVDLALIMARQIVRRELSVKRELILPLVHEALDQLREAPGPATLQLDPLDAVLVGERLAPVLAQRQISVSPDPGIEPGGCRLVGNDAEVDATLQTRWQRLLAAMGREPVADQAAGAGHATGLAHETAVDQAMGAAQARVPGQPMDADQGTDAAGQVVNAAHNGGATEAAGQ